MYACRRILAVLSIVCLLIGIPDLHAQWIENGVPVCTAPGYQVQPDIVGDGAGGAILAWVDARGGEDDII